MVRIKRTQGIDHTAIEVLVAASLAMAARGRRLILVGMRPPEMEALERSGAAESIGWEQIFPSQAGWFAATSAGVERALQLVEPHHCDECPLDDYTETTSLE